MSEPHKLPDKHVTDPIHFSEAFRRAKRNVLFWGATVSIVAIGSAESTAISIAGLVRGLTFDPVLLVIGLTLVLIYMLVGYVRADIDLGYLNSEKVVKQRMNNTVDIAESIERSLLAERTRIAKETERLRQYIERGDAALDRIKHVRATTKIGWQIDDLTWDVVKEDIENKRVDRMGPLFKQREAVMNKEFKDRLASFTEAFEDFLAEPPVPEPYEETNARFASVLQPVRDLTERLHKLSGLIGVRQKFFFYSHDRGAVGVLTFAALVLAFVRIVCPQTMAALFAPDTVAGITAQIIG